MASFQHHNRSFGTLVVAAVSIFLLIGAAGGYFLYESNMSIDSNASMQEASQESGGFFTGSDERGAQDTDTSSASRSVKGVENNVTSSPESSRCSSLACINKQLSACNPTVYISSAGKQLAAKYEIRGEANNACRVELTYIRHPDPNKKNKELVCNYDTNLTLPEASQKALQSVFESNQAKCSGPLYKEMRN